MDANIMIPQKYTCICGYLHIKEKAEEEWPAGHKKRE
jgi:hypothetical protein